MRRRTAVLADWNAKAHSDTGRYSPQWIAEQTGLSIADAGPGRHGNIDYALTDALLLQCRRLGNGQMPHGAPGSDHDALLFVFGSGSGLHVRVLLWNTLRDRSVRLVIDQLDGLIEESQPGVIVLNEAAQYVARIAAQYAPHWIVVTGDEQENRQNVIMINRRHDVTGKRVPQLSRAGWTTVEGKPHGPIYGPSCVIDGWLRIIGVHMPPSVNWRKGKGLPYGPILRVAVYVTAARKLVRWIKHWKAEQ